MTETHVASFSNWIIAEKRPELITVTKRFKIRHEKTTTVKPTLTG